MNNCFCSIATYNYLPYIKSLYYSLKKTGNAADFIALIIDRSASEITITEDFKILCLSEVLNANDKEYFTISFDAFELCNLLKPFLLKHLLKLYEKVIYLDSDIFVTDSMEEIFSTLDKKDFAFVPHNLYPVNDNKYFSEHGLVQFGFFNGGLYAFKKSENSFKALNWLEETLKKYCFVDWEKGYFVDQKFIPLLQYYFPDYIYIINGPECNIAYWNITERPLKKTGNHYYVGDKKVKYFHFSGYRQTSPDMLCSYFHNDFNNHMKITYPIMWEALGEYHQTLLNNSNPNYNVPYQYATFKGKKLTPFLRRYYFTHKRFKNYYILRLAEIFIKTFTHLKLNLQKKLYEY